MPWTSRGIFHPSMTDTVLPASRDLRDMAGTTDAAIGDAMAEAEWTNAPLVAGADLNTLTTPGAYPVEYAVGSTLKGAPGSPPAGSIEVFLNGSGGVTQVWHSNNVWGGTRTLTRSGAANGTGWTGWTPMSATSEPLRTNDDLNTLMLPGSYSAVATVAKTVLNAPAAVTSGKPFVVTVLAGMESSTRVVQTLTMLPYAAGERPRSFRRSVENGKERSPWVEDVLEASAAATYSVGAKRPMLRQASKLRRGGVVGTAGRTPVAITWDHGFANFRDKVLPVLTRLGLPSTVAVNTNTLGAGESEGVSYPQLQDWCLSHGIELAHHSRDHSDVAFARSNIEALRDKILGTVPLLASECPECVADAYIMPGVSNWQYEQFRGGEIYSDWWEHPAGRIILENFPVVTSLLPGATVPVMGEPVQAVSRVGMDTPSWVAEAQRRISEAPPGHGVVIYMHPSFLDTEGRTTTEQITGLLTWLAAERDAGRVEPLTLSGFAWADALSSHRLDLAPEASWSGGAVTIQVNPRYDWIRGAQLMVQGEGQGMISVTSDAGGLNTQATGNRVVFSVPVSASTITITTIGLTGRSVVPV